MPHGGNMGQDKVIGASVRAVAVGSEGSIGIKALKSERSDPIESFEVVRGGVSGDMLTEKYKASPLKVGLLATAVLPR